MSMEEIGSKTAWGTVRIWDDPDTGAWNAAATKCRADGSRDALQFTRSEKADAMDALLASMKAIDLHDRRVEKQQRETAALQTALEKHAAERREWAAAVGVEE